jgi:Flp pilus assembly pilin Flp
MSHVFQSFLSDESGAVPLTVALIAAFALPMILAVGERILPLFDAPLAKLAAGLNPVQHGEVRRGS